MRRGCNSCSFMKIKYRATLDGKAYCTYFKKYIQEDNLEYNFFCDGDINGSKRSDRLSKEIS